MVRTPIYKLSFFLVSMILFTFSANALNVALKNVNVVDVEELTMLQEQTVYISHGMILSEDEAKRVNDDFVTIDLTGKYIIPGLIDTHVHHGTVPDDTDSDEITRKRLRLLLRGGVTSVRDMGGDVRSFNH